MKTFVFRLAVGSFLLSFLILGCFAAGVRADQHRLHEALKSLLEAREALVADGDSYGGHREKAMRSLEDTIDEVRKSIKHEDSEERPGKKHK